MTLSRPRGRPIPIAPRITPGFSIGGALAAQERTISAAFSSRLARRRCRSPPPAPCRNRTAPNSGRRCSARRGRPGGSPRLIAIFSSDEPGSVIATKRWPALAVPIALARSKKYCLKMLGSSVLPDLLDTMNSVRRDRRPSRSAGSAPGRSSRARAASGSRASTAESLGEAPRGRGSSRPCRAAARP